MASRSEITTRLASRLKEERSAKGLSLDALAKLSGVSRSMLSQIERAESSPTVASLWNLTRALNLDFSTLLDQDTEPDQSIREVILAANTPVIRNSDAGYEIRILSSSEEVGGTEVYDLRLDPGASLESAPHKTGCVEHLTILDGAVSVTSDGETVEINEGDTIRYAADVDHAITAKPRSRAILIVKTN